MKKTVSNFFHTVLGTFEFEECCSYVFWFLIVTTSLFCVFFWLLLCCTVLYGTVLHSDSHLFYLFLELRFPLRQAMPHSTYCQYMFVQVMTDSTSFFSISGHRTVRTIRYGVRDGTELLGFLFFWSFITYTY